MLGLSISLGGKPENLLVRGRKSLFCEDRGGLLAFVGIKRVVSNDRSLSTIKIYDQG